MVRLSQPEQTVLAAALVLLVAASAALVLLGPSGQPARPLAAPPLDLNTATAEDLEGLPGVGPVLAQRIIAYRDRHGPFRDLEDLLKVPGVGPALLGRLRPHLRLP